MNRIRFQRYLSGRAAVSIAFAGTIFAAAATIPMSELPSIGGGSPGRALGINDRGDVVGQSYTVGFENHATVWAVGGVPRDLGVLPGGSESWAAAISPSGVIVGMSGTAAVANHAALWPSATSAPIDLGTLGGANSQADGVNANGDAVGYSWMPGETITLHAVLWPAANRSNPVDLGTLSGGSYSRAYAINASGDIVGTSDDNQWTSHPVIWPATSQQAPVVLQALGGPSFGGEALGINDKGDVVGVSYNAAWASRPTLWPAAGRAPVDLGTLGGIRGAANSVNALGDIVGFSNTAGDLVGHATLWRVSGSSGSPPSSGSGCRSRNGRDEKSRRDRDEKSRKDRDDRSRRDRDGRRSGSAVVIAPTSAPASGALTPIDLGTLPGGSFSQAASINASGQIVGVGTNVTNESRAMSWAAGTASPPPAGGGKPHEGNHNGNHENEGDEDGDC